MTFNKISLLPNGMIYILWTSAIGNTFESWLEPIDAIEFVKELVKL
jgi:hypothetical protein